MHSLPVGVAAGASDACGETGGATGCSEQLFERFLYFGQISVF
jgi:hypothetical protein